MKHNRLPAAPIQEVVKDYLEKQWQISDDIAPLTMLALRCDLQEDTLYRAVFMEQKTIDFDMADLLFTKMGCVDLWWGRLNDIYVGCTLTEGVRKKPMSVRTRLCAAPLCSTRFEPPTSRRIYCTPRCKARAEYHRKSLQGRYGNIDKCPHGHEWSSENTRTDTRTGKRYCKACQAADQRKRRAQETPERRQERLDYMRAYAQSGRIAA